MLHFVSSGSQTISRVQYNTIHVTAPIVSLHHIKYTVGLNDSPLYLYFSRYLVLIHQSNVPSRASSTTSTFSTSCLYPSFFSFLHSLTSHVSLPHVSLDPSACTAVMAEVTNHPFRPICSILSESLAMNLGASRNSSYVLLQLINKPTIPSRHILSGSTAPKPLFLSKSHIELSLSMQ